MTGVIRVCVCVCVCVLVKNFCGRERNNNIRLLNLGACHDCLQYINTNTTKKQLLLYLM
jgi:hypothetical protein